MAHLTLQSERGDFIGQGQNWDITYTDANSDFFFARVVTPNVGGLPAYVEFILGTVTSGTDNTFTGLDFSTRQLGIPITPGTFSDAERAAFASAGHPGLDVSFQNRGCNTVAGSFTVQNATFVADSGAPGGFLIDTFQASFEQHCEGGTPALFGTLSYDGDITAQVALPATLALFGLGLAALGLGRRKPA